VDEAVARLTARLHMPDPRPVRDAHDFAPMDVSVLNPWTGWKNTH
jgi:hypothetical protein